MDPRRNETEAEKYDRNWVELLQELRVTQTGVQILAGFLLTLPFTNQFGRVASGYRILFLVAFGLATISIALIVAPVSAHRFMFGRHEKDVLVHVSSGFAKVGLTALALTIVTVVVLIFGVVLGAAAGVVAGAVMLVVFALVCVVLPLRLMRDRAS